MYDKFFLKCFDKILVGLLVLTHILTARDFTPEFLNYLYGLASDIKRHPDEFTDTIRGKRLT